MSASPVRFSGHLWSVKTSMEPVGPGPNRFAAANVTVDVRGRLVLAISPDALGWTCAEVVAQGGFGYGVYDWTVSSGVEDFDPAVVLGLFTWSDAARSASMLGKAAATYQCRPPGWPHGSIAGSSVERVPGDRTE